MIQMFQEEQVGVLTYLFYDHIHAITILMLVVQVDPKTQQPIPVDPETLWEVEVRTASPIRNTQETPISQSIDAVLEVQLLMKGLIDLRRQDA